VIPSERKRERWRERERGRRKMDVIGRLSLSSDRSRRLTSGPRHHPSIDSLSIPGIKNRQSRRSVARPVADTHLRVSKVDAVDRYKSCFVADVFLSIGRFMPSRQSRSIRVAYQVPP